jgi:hypothetical protein
LRVKPENYLLLIHPPINNLKKELVEKLLAMLYFTSMQELILMYGKAYIYLYSNP